MLLQCVLETSTSHLLLHDVLSLQPLILHGSVVGEPWWEKDGIYLFTFMKAEISGAWCCG